MSEHGIDHEKTFTRKGSCQPGYVGKPFTCLCGDGKFTMAELAQHMTRAMKPASPTFRDKRSVA